MADAEAQGRWRTGMTICSRCEVFVSCYVDLGLKVVTKDPEKFSLHDQNHKVLVLDSGTLMAVVNKAYILPGDYLGCLPSGAQLRLWDTSGLGRAQGPLGMEWWMGKWTGGPDSKGSLWAWVRRRLGLGAWSLESLHTGASPCSEPLFCLFPETFSVLASHLSLAHDKGSPIFLAVADGELCLCCEQDKSAGQPSLRLKVRVPANFLFPRPPHRGRPRPSMSLSLHSLSSYLALQMQLACFLADSTGQLTPYLLEEEAEASGHPAESRPEALHLLPGIGGLPEHTGVGHAPWLVHQHLLQSW